MCSVGYTCGKNDVRIMGMRFSALHKLLSFFEARPKCGWSNRSWGPDGDTAISFLRLRIGCEWTHPQGHNSPWLVCNGYLSNGLASIV